jgi:hypothetical protein
MKERRFRFRYIGQPIKSWLYFGHFFFLPAIGTFDTNDYQYGRKWMYVRIYALYIFWWEFAIEWRHGEAKKILKINE